MSETDHANVWPTWYFGYLRFFHIQPKAKPGFAQCCVLPDVDPLAGADPFAGANHFVLCLITIPVQFMVTDVYITFLMHGYCGTVM